MRKVRESERDINIERKIRREREKVRERGKKVLLI